MAREVREALSRLRENIYSLLTAVSEPPSEQNNLVARQNMDLQLSPGVRKGGVNIFQFQNAIIDNRIVNHVVTILKNVDELRDIISVESGLDAFFDKLVEEGITWREFIRLMQKELILAYLRRGMTYTETAKRLGVQRTYLSRVVTNLGLRDEISQVQRRK